MLARSDLFVLRCRLVPSFRGARPSLQLSLLVRTIIGWICHDLCTQFAILLALSAFFAPLASPQINRTPGAVPPNAPPSGFYDIEATSQEVAGSIRKLRGKVRLQTTEMVLYADEIDFDADAGYAEARGNVHFKSFSKNEEIWASKVEYYTDEEKGKFYDVVGTAGNPPESGDRGFGSSCPFHFSR